jgi:hypothetical protein
MAGGSLTHTPRGVKNDTHQAQHSPFFFDISIYQGYQDLGFRRILQFLFLEFGL